MGTAFIFVVEPAFFLTADVPALVVPVAGDLIATVPALAQHDLLDQQPHPHLHPTSPSKLA